LLIAYRIFKQIDMDGFVYAIGAILGAILVLVGIDAYIFICEVASRQ
jgi:hypothetical protein